MKAQTKPQVFVQLLTRAEPLAVIDPDSGSWRILHKFPTSGGDPLERIDRSGNYLVWTGPAGTYAIDADLRGEPRVLAPGPFVPSATPGRVWFVYRERDRHIRLREPTTVLEMTGAGRVTSRAEIEPPCRGAIVAATTSALLCQNGAASSMLAIDPRTGAVTRRVAGSFPFATHGNLVASCDAACRAALVTNIATGRELAIPPPPGYRYVEGYDGAFSPAGRFVAVPIAVLGRPVRGDRRDRLRVALIDLAQRSAQVVPASRLAGDYRNLTWSRSGELFFASRRGTLMRYLPGSAEARLVGVRLGAPMLDIAAD